MKETKLDDLLKQEMKYTESATECCQNCEYSYPIGVEIRCNYNRACHLMVSPSGKCGNWKKEEVLDMSNVPQAKKIHDEPIIGGDNPSNEKEIKDRIGPDIEPDGQLLKS